ncbi:MAG: dockerin type I repeat-containing protein [Bacteroidaceae bacterium]|nr:dockerin type I repeat-containing protein [Bacteroidaceae bacterium]
MGSGEVVQGDASGDGIIDAVDFNMIANEILGYHQDNFNRAAADINGDNEVDAIDFNMIANKILYGNFDGVQGNKMNKKKTEITESEDSKEPM